MANLFSIPALFDKFFGIKAETLTFEKNGTVSKPGKNDALQFNQATGKTDATTSLGSPLYKAMPNDALGRYWFLPTTIDGVVMPNSVIRISCQKNVVVTPLVKRKGTVKELINIDDYNIRIMGFIIGDEFPDDGMKLLADQWKKNISLKIENAVTDYFLDKDDKVVLIKIDLPEATGIKGVRKYSIDMLSDEDFTLIID